MKQTDAPRWAWVVPALVQFGVLVICVALADMVAGGIISRAIHQALFGF